MKSIACIAAVGALLLACDRAPTSSDARAGSSGTRVGFSPPTNTTCNNTGNGGDGHWWKNGSGNNEFPCGAYVRVVDQSGLSLSGPIATAVQIWHDGVLQYYNLPQFSTTQSTGPVVTVKSVGTGSNYCGYTPSRTDTVYIYRATDTLCYIQGFPARAVASSNTTNVARLIAHELGHALGFNGHWVTGQAVYTEQHVAKCLNTMPPDYNSSVPLNGSVCEHERQLIYFEYGLQPNDPSPDRDFLGTIEASPGTVSLDLNASAGVTISDLIAFGQNGDYSITPAPTDVFSWALGSGTPPGAFTITNTSGTSTTVNGTSTAGINTLTADLVSTDGYNIRWPFGMAMISVSTRGPAASPSALTVTNLGATVATTNWTAGDVVATTTVQYRVAGAPSWTTAGSAATGVTTFGLSSLSSCTSYDVQLYHVRNTLPSPFYTVANAFRTTGGAIACAPSNFGVTQCHATVINGRTYRTYYVAWTRGEYSVHSTYEIGQASSNDTALAAVIRSGGSDVTTDSLGPYQQKSFPQLTYFWVRHKLSNGSPSAWVALWDNPLDVGQPC